MMHENKLNMPKLIEWKDKNKTIPYFLIYLNYLIA